MRELYTIHTYPDHELVEVNSYANLTSEVGMQWHKYFSAYRSLCSDYNYHPIPDHIKLLIDRGEEPYLSAAINHWCRESPLLKARHRLLLQAQVCPQIIHASRASTMLYGCDNESGVWGTLNTEAMVTVAANGVASKPQPFAIRIPSDAPLLPNLLDGLYGR